MAVDITGYVRKINAAETTSDALKLEQQALRNMHETTSKDDADVWDQLAHRAYNRYSALAEARIREEFWARTIREEF